MVQYNYNYYYVTERMCLCERQMCKTSISKREN